MPLAIVRNLSKDYRLVPKVPNARQNRETGNVKSHVYFLPYLRPGLKTRVWIGVAEACVEKRWSIIL